jgi:Zn finger protein HypA/HybF involved in hydrogenase expression
MAINAGTHKAIRRESFMAEGYCVKCKASKEIAEAVEVVMKNGRKATKGKCPVCGTVMFKILGGKATNTPPAVAPPTPGV